MFWIRYSTLATIKMQSSLCKTGGLVLSKLWNGKLGKTHPGLCYCCCRHGNGFSFSLPHCPSTLYCHRWSSQLPPQFLNSKNIKGSFLTHLKIGASEYTDQVTCSGQWKLNIFFKKTAWAGESHRTNQHKKRVFSISQHPSGDTVLSHSHQENRAIFLVVPTVWPVLPVNEYKLDEDNADYSSTFNVPVLSNR